MRRRHGAELAMYLTERMRLDLRELVLHVVGVHGADLVSGGCSQHLDDLYQLINARLAREQWLSKHQLCHDATCGPNIYTQILAHTRTPLIQSTPCNQHTDLGGVVCRSKDQLGRAVVPGADVRHIRLILYQDLCASEIAQLQHTSRRVQKEVLGLDVSMADALGVDVGEGAEELVDVQLDFEDGHDRLHLVEVARRPVDSLGNKLQHEIQVDLVLLWLKRLATRTAKRRACLQTHTRSPLL